jgi:hypothetical protein
MRMQMVQALACYSGNPYGAAPPVWQSLQFT